MKNKKNVTIALNKCQSRGNKNGNGLDISNQQNCPKRIGSSICYSPKSYNDYNQMQEEEYSEREGYHDYNSKRKTFNSQK